MHRLTFGNPVCCFIRTPLCWRPKVMSVRPRSLFRSISFLLLALSGSYFTHRIPFGKWLQNICDYNIFLHFAYKLTAVYFICHFAVLRRSFNRPILAYFSYGINEVRHKFLKIRKMFTMSSGFIIFLRKCSMVWDKRFFGYVHVTLVVTTIHLHLLMFSSQLR